MPTNPNSIFNDDSPYGKSDLSVYDAIEKAIDEIEHLVPTHELEAWFDCIKAHLDEVQMRIEKYRTT